jgi:hypothetical protein
MNDIWRVVVNLDGGRRIVVTADGAELQILPPPGDAPWYIAEATDDAETERTLRQAMNMIADACERSRRARLLAAAQRVMTPEAAEAYFRERIGS